jgi:predicted metallopeptidase
MRRLCGDIATRCPALRHIDPARLLVGITQARNGRLHGLQARVTPLRFRHGGLLRRRHGVEYRVQRYFVNGREMLYLITFCLPRFLDQDFDQKLITIFHELYHISPAFDGDLRRFPGKNYAHGVSREHYHAAMKKLAARYLSDGPRAHDHEFLRVPFPELMQRHGGIIYTSIPRPRPYRV